MARPDVGTAGSTPAGCPELGVQINKGRAQLLNGDNQESTLMRHGDERESNIPDTCYQERKWELEHEDKPAQTGGFRCRGTER